MPRNYRKPLFLFFLSLLVLLASARPDTNERNYVSYTVDCRKQTIRFYWKDKQHQPLGSLGRLKEYVEAQHKQLIFAMNGGMYKTDQSPLGLYVENGKEYAPLNKKDGGGNFYLQPNGVFFITKKGKAELRKTEKFISDSTIQYATQSGPMLVIDGLIHPEFKQGSTKLNIRNGVGILPNGQVLFAMSKHPVSLYDFAHYFKQRGCRNALYLDGFVSRTYFPEKNWIQTDGQFGVMIAVER